MATDRNKALRENARKLHRRATDKVSRTKRFHNIDIAGTSLDPRVPAAEIAKMNARELRSYSAKVGGFLSRNVQFSQGAQGTVIDHAMFVRQYLPVERAYNAMVKQRREAVDKLILPQYDPKVKPKTIGERREYVNRIQNGGPSYAVGDILNDPYATIHRKPGFVKGNEALARIIEDMKFKMTAGYKEQMIKEDRETVNKALDAMGLSDLKKTKYEDILDEEGKPTGEKTIVQYGFDILTNFQFDILFNESTFAENFFPRYIEMKSKMGQMDDEEVQEKKEDTLIDIEWASQIKLVHPKAITDLADLNTMAPPKGIKLGQIFDRKKK